MRLSKDDIAILKDLNKPGLYGAQVPTSRVRRSLEMRRLIEWIPPKFGTQLWAITEAGREELKRTETV